MRKSRLLAIQLLAFCSLLAPLSASAQCLPAQGCLGASNTGALGAIPLGSGHKFEERVLPACADTAGKHLNFTSGGGVTCGTSSGTVGLTNLQGTCTGSHKSVEFDSGGHASCTTSGGDVSGPLNDLQIGADTIGISELADDGDTATTGDCVRVAADPTKVTYGSCGGGSDPAPTDGACIQYRYADGMGSGGWTMDPMPLGPFFKAGKPGAGEIVFLAKLTGPLNFLGNFGGSGGYALTGATSDAVYTIAFASHTFPGTFTDVGTITFRAGYEGGVDYLPQFDYTPNDSDFSWAINGSVKVTAPATQDATLSDVSITLWATQGCGGMG
jgi:hypothetical protein